ncbi:4908_t:CDS:1, partial [Funneliformis mosseae]
LWELLSLINSSHTSTAGSASEDILRRRTDLIITQLTNAEALIL